jgi:MFS family permease
MTGHRGRQIRAVRPRLGFIREAITSRRAFWAGLLTTAQSTTMDLIAPMWGMLSDRYGRKIMVTRAMWGEVGPDASTF